MNVNQTLVERQAEQGRRVLSLEDALPTYALAQCLVPLREELFSCKANSSAGEGFLELK